MNVIPTTVRLRPDQFKKITEELRKNTCRETSSYLLTLLKIKVNHRLCKAITLLSTVFIK